MEPFSVTQIHSKCGLKVSGSHSGHAALRFNLKLAAGWDASNAAEEFQLHSDACSPGDVMALSTARQKCLWNTVKISWFGCSAVKIIGITAGYATTWQEMVHNFGCFVLTAVKQCSVVMGRFDCGLYIKLSPILTSEEVFELITLISSGCYGDLFRKWRWGFFLSAVTNFEKQPCSFSLFD